MATDRRIELVDRKMHGIKSRVDSLKKDAAPVTAELNRIQRKIQSEKEGINIQKMSELRTLHDMARTKLARIQASIQNLNAEYRKLEIRKLNLKEVAHGRHLLKLSHVLSNFPACCAYDSQPPRNEKDVQISLWKMLRAICSNVEREPLIRASGQKTYHCDFGFPDHRALLEIKFISTRGGSVLRMQDEITIDLKRFFGREQRRYDKIAFFIYDRANALLNKEMWIDQLRSEFPEIFDIIVIPRLDRPRKRTINEPELYRMLG